MKRSVCQPLMLNKTSSVLIDSEETDPVELRKFGDEHGEQGNGVDDEVDPIILCIETGQEIPVEGKDKDKIKSDVRQQHEKHRCRGYRSCSSKHNTTLHLMGSQDVVSSCCNRMLFIHL